MQLTTQKDRDFFQYLIECDVVSPPIIQQWSEPAEPGLIPFLAHNEGNFAADRFLSAGLRANPRAVHIPALKEGGMLPKRPRRLISLLIEEHSVIPVRQVGGFTWFSCARFPIEVSSIIDLIQIPTDAIGWNIVTPKAFLNAVSIYNSNNGS